LARKHGAVAATVDVLTHALSVSQTDAASRWGSPLNAWIWPKKRTTSLCGESPVSTQFGVGVGH
jgi:hypothetical protein